MNNSNHKDNPRFDNIIPNERPEYNTLAKQLKTVKENGNSIAYINNPCELVQLAAVRFNGNIIYHIFDKGITPSIPVQRDAVMKEPVSALYHMVNRNFPISKVIQWTAAKQIKERNLKISRVTLVKLDPDVQEYLRDNQG